MKKNSIDMSHTIFTLSKAEGKTKIIWNYQFLSPENKIGIDGINLLYNKQYFIWLNDTRNRLKPRQKRTCRFCGRSYPETRFSKDAHVFPESLGNRYHLTDSECDECNLKFSIYENDFVNFLGPFRTLSGISGKKGVPTFTSRDRSARIQMADDNILDITYGKSIIKDQVYFNKDGKITRFKYEGNPYTPLNVYKCLLKTSLLMVNESELENLSDTNDFLMNSDYEPQQKNDFIFSVHEYFIPGNFNYPPFLLYFTKDQKFAQYPSPSIIFVYYIRNIILQTFIPFHRKDIFFYNPDIERNLFVVPPLIKEKWFSKYGGPFSKMINLNDQKRVDPHIQAFEWVTSRK